jgi:hypothetical protein
MMYRYTRLLVLMTALCGCAVKQGPAEVEAEPPPVEERLALYEPPSSTTSEAVRDYLEPGRAFPTKPVPPVSEPSPRRTPSVTQKAELAPLPSALDKHATPRILPAEKTATGSKRPVRDAQPLTLDAEPTPPSRPVLAAPPRAFATAPEAAQPPILEIVPVPRPRDGDVDPTTERSRRSALSEVSVLRTQPAPFLRWTIPDPFELTRLTPLRDAPVETDPPLSSPLRPPLPPLK